jgi:hypothetical protein
MYIGGLRRRINPSLMKSASFPVSRLDPLSEIINEEAGVSKNFSLTATTLMSASAIPSAATPSRFMVKHLVADIGNA